MSSDAHHRYLKALGDAESTARTTNPSATSGRSCARRRVTRLRKKPILGSYFHATILNHKSFGSAAELSFGQQAGQPHAADDADP